VRLVRAEQPEHVQHLLEVRGEQVVCCSKPCLIRVYEAGAWFYRCLNCTTLIPA